jgi:hypothetical protein
MADFTTGSVTTVTLASTDTIVITGTANVSVSVPRAAPSILSDVHTESVNTVGRFGPYGSSATLTIVGQSAGSYVYDKSGDITPAGPILLSATQIATPTAAILADTTATYIGPDFTHYYSNGVQLLTSGAGPAGDSTYVMPPPTGVVATDQAALVAAFASSKKTVVFVNEGTYLTNAQISWPINKYLLSTCAYGTVIIQAASTATMTNMFSGASGVTNFGADNITIDANQAARFAATGHTASNALEWTTGTCSASRWKNCIFKGLRNDAVTVTGSDHHFERCTFGPSQGKVLTLLGGSRIVLERCTFYDYNTGLVGSPAVGMQEFNNLGAKDVKFLHCHFVPLTSTWVSIEAVSTAIGRYPQIHVDHCTFHGIATAVAGVGISGGFGYSHITFNRFLAVGTNTGSGIEIFGPGNTIEGNYLENTSVDLVRSAYEIMRGNKVLGNTFNWAILNTTEQLPLKIQDQEQLLVSGNTFVMTPTGTSTINSCINLGKSVGGVRKSRIVNNTFRLVATIDYNCIRFDGAVAGGGATGQDYIVDVEVSGNTIANFDNAFRLPGNAVDSYLRIFNNDTRTCTNRYALTATGTGNILEGMTAAISGTGTMTAVALGTGKLIFSGGAGSQTLPTATNIGTQLQAVAGTVFDFSVDNTAGSGTCTIVVNTGIVAAVPIITGGATLTIANSATQGIGAFRLVFSSATAAVLYRIG